MPREDKSKHTNKQMHLAIVVEPSNERRTDSKKEAGRRAWAKEAKKPSVGKKSGSGRRIHSPRDNLPG
jgi:hypothetical protein